MGWFEKLSDAPPYTIDDAPFVARSQEPIARNMHHLKNFGRNDVGLFGFGTKKTKK